MNAWRIFDSMNIVIFSKDRAAQLELFLRSMKKFFPEWSKYSDIHILYTYSTEAFGAAYTKTIALHPEMHYAFENQGMFKMDTLNLIDKKRFFTMFFVDDNIFKNHFTLQCEEVKDFVIREDIACVSLRLCPRINYCYTMNVMMTPPKFLEERHYVWKWYGASPGDWSYPMSLDGHLFKTEEILPLITLLNYSNPNTMEGALANSPFNIPHMICFNDSKIFNVPANKVQSVNNNRHGNVSAQDINEKFLYSNSKLSLDKILNNPLTRNNTSCHQDILLEWE